jgi:hypothetical protein
VYLSSRSQAWHYDARTNERAAIRTRGNLDAAKPRMEKSIFENALAELSVWESHRPMKLFIQSGLSALA